MKLPLFKQNYKARGRPAFYSNTIMNINEQIDQEYHFINGKIDESLGTF